MEYVNEKALRQAINKLPKIETRANELISEIFENVSSFTDQNLLSFIKTPEKVFLTIQKLGCEDAKRFSISTQRELLVQQADATAGRLKQMAGNIFFDTMLSYSDIEKSMYIVDGVLKIDQKKAAQLLTKKYTYALSPVQHDFYKKIENVVKILNSLNEYSESSKIINRIEINNYQFIKGGRNAFNELSPYTVNIENILKYIHK